MHASTATRQDIMSEVTTRTMDIPKGRINALILPDSYQEEREGQIRKLVRISTFPDRVEYDIDSGTRCSGMHCVGTFTVRTTVHAYYSEAKFRDNVSFPPVALLYWGEFLAKFIVAHMEDAN